MQLTTFSSNPFASLVRSGLKISDRAVLAGGDYIGPAGFAIGTAGLQAIDGRTHNGPQEVAVMGWIVLGVVSVTAPFLRHHLPSSQFIQRHFNQNAFRVRYGIALSFCTLTYITGSCMAGALNAAAFGIGALAGNVVMLANDLVLTPQHLRQRFTSAGYALTAQSINRKIERTKTSVNKLAFASRALSYIPLALIDWKHTGIAMLYAVSLHTIHRRVHLQARGSPAHK